MTTPRKSKSWKKLSNAVVPVAKLSNSRRLRVDPRVLATTTGRSKEIFERHAAVAGYLSEAANETQGEDGGERLSGWKRYTIARKMVNTFKMAGATAGDGSGAAGAREGRQLSPARGTSLERCLQSSLGKGLSPGGPTLAEASRTTTTGSAPVLRAEGSISRGLAPKLGRGVSSVMSRGPVQAAPTLRLGLSMANLEGPSKTPLGKASGPGPALKRGATLASSGFKRPVDKASPGFRSSDMQDVTNVFGKLGGDNDDLLAHSFRQKAGLGVLGVRPHKDKGTRTTRRARETQDERERRKMKAVYESSARNKDSEMEREGQVKRLVGGWRSSTTLEFFLAWRELAVTVRELREARGRVTSYVNVLVKRPSHRTEAEVETLYGFVIEKDERFRKMPRYQVMDLCRRMRVEEYAEDEIVVEPGDLDSKVYIVLHGIASEWEAEASDDEDTEDEIVTEDEEDDPEEKGKDEDAMEGEEITEPKEADADVKDDSSAPEEAEGTGRNTPLRTFVSGQSFGIPAVHGRQYRTTVVQTDEPTWFITLDELDYHGTEWEHRETAVRKRLDFLCRLPCFNGSPLLQLAAIAEAMTEHRFEPGATIMKQGQECTGMYMILSGSVSVIRRIDTLDHDPDDDLDVNKGGDRHGNQHFPPNKAMAEPRGVTSKPGPDKGEAIFEAVKSLGKSPLSIVSSASMVTTRRRSPLVKFNITMKTLKAQRKRGSSDPKDQDEYRRWRRQCVGAATASGPGVRDVEVRTVGAFGVVGGRDVITRSPSRFYYVARGMKPVTALHLNFTNFFGKLSYKAIAHFTENCLISPSDNQLRQCLREKRMAEAAERQLWEATPPDHFIMGPPLPPGGYEAETKLALEKAKREHRAERHRQGKTAKPSLIAGVTHVTTRNQVLRRAMTPDVDSNAGAAFEDGRLHDGDDENAGDVDIEGQELPPIMSDKTVIRDADRGRRDPDGYAAVAHRGLVGWPFQRGVYNPGAAPLAGITGGGYTPSGARKRESMEAAAATELHTAVFGAGLPLPPPPLQVGLRAAAKALPPGPRTTAEKEYARFIAGVAAHPPTQTGRRLSKGQLSAGSGQLRSSLELPSQSVRRIHEASKKDLLHDPDMTETLYANERDARTAGGSPRSSSPRSSPRDSPTRSRSPNAASPLSEPLDVTARSQSPRITPATGEEMFSPRTTVVIAPPGRHGGGMVDVEEVGRAGSRSKMPRRRRRNKVGGGAGLAPDSKETDADESASTVNTANKVGKIHVDAKAGKGDAGGDADLDSKHSPGVVLAVCRFVDQKRVPYSSRDDVVVHATVMCMDRGLHCVRWSGDTVLLWAACNDPKEEIRRLTSLMLDVVLELRAFVLKYHEGRKKSHIEPPPGGWLHGDGVVAAERAARKKQTAERAARKNQIQGPSSWGQEVRDADGSGEKVEQVLPAGGNEKSPTTAEGGNTSPEVKDENLSVPDAAATVDSPRTLAVEAEALKAAAAAAAAASAAALAMEPIGDIGVGIATGDAFIYLRAGELFGVEGSVRDAAARLCDLAVESKGGVRADTSVYPFCASSHQMRPTGHASGGVAFGGYVVSGRMKYHEAHTFESLFGEESMKLVDGKPPPWGGNVEHDKTPSVPFFTGNASMSSLEFRRAEESFEGEDDISSWGWGSGEISSLGDRSWVASSHGPRASNGSSVRRPLTSSYAPTSGKQSATSSSALPYSATRAARAVFLSRFNETGSGSRGLRSREAHRASLSSRGNDNGGRRPSTVGVEGSTKRASRSGAILSQFLSGEPSY